MKNNLKVREPGEGIRRRNEVGGQDRAASLLTSNIREEISYIRPENLIPYKNQARKVFNEEEIQGLAQSIKEYGVKQPLLVVRSSDHDGLYEVVSGERRLRASKIAGLEKVPCIIEKNFHQLDEIALIENIQREDLHPVELSRAFTKLLDGKPHGAQEELCQKLGVTKSAMSEIIKLSTLPENIQAILLEKNLKGQKFFRELLNADDMEGFLLGHENIQVSKKAPEARKAKNVIQILSDGNLRINKRVMFSLDRSGKDSLISQLENMISILKSSS